MSDKDQVVSLLEPQNHWDLIPFENEKVLIYVSEYLFQPKLTRERVRKYVRKTIDETKDWGGDFIIPAIIGKTLWHPNGSKVYFDSSFCAIKSDFDYLCKSKSFDGCWIWYNYEKKIILITDAQEIAYVDQYFSEKKDK